MHDLPEYTSGAPLPHPLVEATPEEQAQADADHETRQSPRRFARKGEQWARQRLIRSLGAAFDPKQSDAPRAYTHKGTTFAFRQRQTVDYQGTFPGNPALPFVLEVKTFCERFPLSSLKPHQCKALSAARSAGKLAMVALVERDEAGKILRGFFVPWRGPGEPAGVGGRLPAMDWEMMRRALEDKAREEPRFKAKSIRPQDFRILRTCEVRKIKNRWRMCDWLTVLVKTLGQVTLF
jgi:hypothetical protein